MANTDLPSTFGTKYASNENAHYQIPFLEWFRAGSNYKTYMNSFTPDIGSTTPLNSNVVYPDALDYVSNKGSQFFPQEGKLDNGFSLVKENLQYMKEINIKYQGGSGLWMPCAIFRSFSFYWSNLTALQSNWAPRNIAFEVRDSMSFDKLNWGAGWTTSPITSATGKLYYLNGTSKVNEIRSLGPNWYITGVIFNVRSNSTSSRERPLADLVDCRFGWEHDGLQGTNRMILPKTMIWDDFKDDRQAGIIQFGG